MTSVTTAEREKGAVPGEASPTNRPGDDIAAASSAPLSRPPGPKRRVRSTIVLVALSVVAGFAAWFLLFAVVLTGLQERGTQSRLYEAFRAQLAEETAPLGAPIRQGAPVALISASAANLDNAVVVEGTTSKELSKGPGHLSDTPLPGQAGTSVLFGRSVMFGGPFHTITRLEAGDKITVTTGLGVFTYQVLDVRYPGDRLPRPVGSGGSRLTLVTSASHGWRRGWAPDQAVYVDSTLVPGHASPAPSGIPSTVSKSSQAMQGDLGVLVSLIFWVEALGVAIAGFVWAWLRWGRLQTWLVGVPILIAILWGMSGAVALFLPNLI